MNLRSRHIVALAATYLLIVLLTNAVVLSLSSSEPQNRSFVQKMSIEYSPVVFFVLMAVVKPIAEEVCFRGLFFQTCKWSLHCLLEQNGLGERASELSSFAVAAIANSLCFAWMHGDNATEIFMTYVLFGLLASHLSYLSSSQESMKTSNLMFLTKSMVAPCLLHVGANTTGVMLILLS